MPKCNFDTPEPEQKSKSSDMKNINTKAYWDKQYSAEIGKNEWRRNIVGFGKIRTYLGIRATEKDTILDIGCGYGILLDELKTLNCNLVGWDISEIAVRYIRHKGHTGRCLDFVKYKPAENEKYDYVITSEFLEHVEDAESALSKMNELTEKAVIISVPDNCLPHKDCEEHLQCFNRGSVKSLTDSCNFKKCYIEEYIEEFVRSGADRTKSFVIRRPSLLIICEK